MAEDDLLDSFFLENENCDIWDVFNSTLGEDIFIATQQRFYLEFFRMGPHYSNIIG